MLLALHAALSNSLLLLLIICLGWSVIGIVTGRGVAPGLRGTVAVTLVVAVGQLLLGIVMLTQGRLFSPIHALYGISLIAALTGALVYGSRQPRQREVLIFALASAFSIGLVLRAIETVARLD